MPGLNSPEVRRFEQIATEYCRFLESAGETTLGPLVVRLEQIIPSLYAAAANLPDVSPDTDVLASDSAQRPETADMQAALASLFGKYDLYRFIFNPFELEDDEPTCGLLSAELVEIYEDLYESLQSPGLASENDVLWEWRFSFTSHWGRHAAAAIPVLYALIRSEYVQVLDSESAGA